MRRGVGALLLAAGGALAAEDPARAQVEQRLQLGARLFADQNAANRIAGSGNAQALSHFEAGRLHQAMAEDAFAKGDFAQARREAEDALRLLALARRLVPDQQARRAAARGRYEAKLAELERLVESSQRQPGGALDGDLLAAGGLVETAKAFARDGRFEEADFTLGSAESHVLAGMNRLLRERTIDYTQRPASPAEEFQLELARHKGLADLVPLALHELKPAPGAAQLIERFGKTSQTLRGQALERFQGGDTPQALADIRNAILYLHRALAAAGLSTPDATGNPP